MIAGVTLYGGPRASSFLNLEEVRSFHHEYNSRACTIEIVDDVEAAVDHIRKHGRHAIFVSFRKIYTSVERKKLVIFLLYHL